MTNRNTSVRLFALLTPRLHQVCEKSCTFAAVITNAHSVMTETKKDFKDWDISDFKDFTDMGGMQKFEESRSHRPFFGFNKQPKGTPHRPYKNYPTSNLADVL